MWQQDRHWCNEAKLLLILQQRLGAAFGEGLRRQDEMRRVGESTAKVEAGSAVYVWKGCGKTLVVQLQDSHCGHKAGWLSLFSALPGGCCWEMAQDQERGCWWGG